MRCLWLVTAILFGVCLDDARGQSFELRESLEGKAERLRSELKTLERRREVVVQRVSDLMRRRISHDLLVPLVEDELLAGMPSGDPVQREALEKKLVEETEAARALRDALQSMRLDLDRSGLAVASPSPSGDAAQLPASPSGSVPLEVDTAAKKPVAMSAPSEDLSRFFRLPLRDEKSELALHGALPFAFDEVANSLPADASVVVIAPSDKILQRVRALVAAGLSRRALEVLRAHASDEATRPLALRFLEARILESTGRVSDAETILAAIIDVDQVTAPVGAVGADASAAAKADGPWAKAARTARSVLQFERRVTIDRLPTTTGIRW